MAARSNESRAAGRRPRHCPLPDERAAYRPCGGGRAFRLVRILPVGSLCTAWCFSYGSVNVAPWIPHHKPGPGPSDKNKTADAREKAPRETADKIHTKKSARRSSPRRLSAFKTNYSALIAPVGQAPSQAPQSMQLPASTTALSAMLIAPTGQVSTQAPQATHSSETI